MLITARLLKESYTIYKSEIGSYFSIRLRFEWLADKGGAIFYAYTMGADTIFLFIEGSAYGSADSGRSHRLKSACCSRETAMCLA